MAVRFINLNEAFRYQFNDAIDYINDHTATVDELSDVLLQCLFGLKKDNYELYKNLLGLVASDHYKQLIDRKICLMPNEYDEEKIKIYEDLYDQEDIITLYENNDNLLIEALLEMYNFNSYGYFYQRQIMLRFKDNFSQLKKFSFFNIYDYLYYCQNYNIDIFKHIYNDNINQGVSKKESIDILIDTLNELGIVDIQNYVDLISDLLLLYYNIIKYEIDNYRHIDKLNMLKKNLLHLEKSDVRDLIKRFNNDKFVSEVLHRIINFRLNNIQLNSTDEVYRHTVKKLESIKRFIK